MKSPGTTPIRLVHLALSGALLIPSVIATPTLPRFGTGILQGFFGLTILAASCGLCFINIGRLKAGIKRGLWSEDQLALARHFIQQRWLSRLQFASFLCAFALCIARVAFHFGPGMLFTVFLVPASALTELQQALHRSVSSGIGDRTVWADLKPLQSAHWGEPPATT